MFYVRIALIALLCGCNKNTTVNQYGQAPPEEQEQAGGSGSEGGSSGGTSGGESGAPPGGVGGDAGAAGVAGAAGAAGAKEEAGKGGSGGSENQEKKYVPDVYFEGNAACLACINGMSGKLNGSGPACDNVAKCLSTIIDTTVDHCQGGLACIQENHVNKGKSWGCTLTVCETNFDASTDLFWNCVAQKCAAQCGIKVDDRSPPWTCP